jgi:iron complex transport system ATP-binding protein
VIEASNVTVRVGATTLLDRVGVRVADGELLAIVGPNGAGKSTLLGALAGDRRIDHGTIAIDGRPLTGISIAALSRLRAVLPQRSELALSFTALEVVRLASPTVDDALARRCLTEVELAGFADRDYTTLSGGEQQRVQLARVLAQLAPRSVLLLDEPTAALDLKHQQLVLGLARRAARDGHPVIVVLHDLTLAARTCDRAVLLARGRIAAEGPPDHVFDADTLAAAYGIALEVVRGDGGVVIAPRSCP